MVYYNMVEAYILLYCQASPSPPENAADDSYNDADISTFHHLIILPWKMQNHLPVSCRRLNVVFL